MNASAYDITDIPNITNTARVFDTTAVSAVTDVRVLDCLLALNLEVCVWSARKKLTIEDFGGADLPPEDLASLGSKKVCDPEALRIFGTLKNRAFTLLDRNGVRFLGGWAIPENKAVDIITELRTIRDDFLAAKEHFLAGYDEAIQQWICRHPGWETLIADSTVSADYVRSRLSFKWQVYKVQNPQAMDTLAPEVSEGLTDEVTSLGWTLFGEIAKSAEDAWTRTFVGRASVTQKALSPLRTIQTKLIGMTFMEPRVAPIADIIQATFDHLPCKGEIQGRDLLMLHGLVCLLRDPHAMLAHGQQVIDGQSPSAILKGLLTQPVQVSTPDTENLFEESSVASLPPLVDLADLLMPPEPATPLPIMPPVTSIETPRVPVPPPAAPLDSLGLW